MVRRKLVASSKKPGRTKTLTFFRVGPHPGKVVLVDAPGYGQRGRPEWGQLFDQYLMTRRELCRVYVLLNAKHGLSEADKLMIQSGDAKWTLQAIVTKADIVSPDKLDAAIKGIKQAIFENAPTCLPPIVTASSKSNGLGVSDVRRSIVEACGLARSVSRL
ncbi:hypothetical protein BC826DRAFT_995972 [Russula brevipes]|nr:hypothetical protein BC826DRAFT_995972 [Russula brevipes]